MSLHRKRVHPTPVEGCFGCKLSTLQIGRRTHGQERQTEFQRQWAAEFHNGDREAYRRLRADGLQPPTIRGSAHLERHAETAFEVESGGVFPEADRKKMTAALKVAADGGFDPLRPGLVPKEG